jgi:SAM-dependent methyltransferase
MSDLIVPDDIVTACADSLGAFFEPISKRDRLVLAQEHLAVGQSIKKAEILERYVDLSGKKLLEIGSGYGTCLAAWIKEFGVDGYGVEPSSLGFEASYKASKRIFEVNGLNPEHIIDATGENLPFEDASFDVIYCANVLEHVQDPEKVVKEAIRVLRPSGIFHAEIPNYLSFFEGHYYVLQPPMLSKQALAFWVHLLGRDPSFAHTLNMINPIWCKDVTKRLNKNHSVELLSVGEDIFLDRLNQKPFVYHRLSTFALTPVFNLIQRLNFGNWIGNTFCKLQTFYPIFWTIRKIS